MVTFIHSLSLSCSLSLALSLIQEIVEILNNCIREILSKCTRFLVIYMCNTPETNTNKESVFGITTLTSVLL